MGVLQSSGAISISQIKTHLGSGSNSLATLSGAANEYSGYTGLNDAPYAMSEFYAHDTSGGVSVDSWPSGQPTWSFNWVTNPAGGQAFAKFQVTVDSSNNRLVMEYMEHNSSSMGSWTTSYLNYSGLSSPSFQIKAGVSTSYAYSNQGTGPFVPSGFPTNNTAYTESYASLTSTKQYRWLAQRILDGNTDPGTAQAGCTGFNVTVKISDSNLSGGYVERSTSGHTCSNRVTEGIPL